MSLHTLGYELTDEQWVELKRLAELAEERAEEMSDQLAQGGNGDGVAFQPEDPKDKPDPFQERGKAMNDALADWKRKAINHLQRGNPGKGRKYESRKIPPALAGAISGALEETETEEEIVQVFDDPWMGYQ